MIYYNASILQANSLTADQLADIKALKLIPTFRCPVCKTELSHKHKNSHTIISSDLTRFVQHCSCTSPTELVVTMDYPISPTSPISFELVHKRITPIVMSLVSTVAYYDSKE